MIKITRYSQLDRFTKGKLKNYIESEFGHIPIVRETKWAKPDWTILLYQDNEILSFYNIVERNIRIDDNPIKIAGISNVITPKAYRGNGYASKILRETKHVIFEDLNCEIGVLLCADNLIPFYERLHWHKVDCPLFFEQPEGKRLWTANVMLLSEKHIWSPKKIDLNGLPF